MNREGYEFDNIWKLNPRIEKNEIFLVSQLENFLSFALNWKEGKLA